MPPVAIAKIGSTSSTLLVAESLQHPLVRMQRLVNLYAPSGPTELIDLLSEWSYTVHDLGVNVLMAGGEALRRNPALVRQVRINSPHWWNLSGADEGRVAWMAVKAEIPTADVVIDIGGGSTEIIGVREALSFPVGAAQGDDRAVHWSIPKTSNTPVFIGGTASALHHFRPQPDYGVQDVLDLMKAVSATRSELPGVDPERVGLLPKGLRILLAILEQGGWNRFMVSERGLTEGLWLCASLGRNRRR